jgi:hypothetical protein
MTVFDEVALSFKNICFVGVGHKVILGATG